MAHNERNSVSLWHPWLDKPGLRHTLALYSDFSFNNVDQIVNTIGGNSYYAFCSDILNPREVSNDLLTDPRTEAYLSRTGNVAALRIRSKRHSGFLIPAIQWGYTNSPDVNTTTSINRIFSTFNLEAITPSSLSEKILRRTLPEHTIISRPNVMLRRALLKNNKGGRIYHRQGSYEEAFEYDANKKYLSVAAKGVPDPFVSPIRFYGSNIWQSCSTSWLEATFTAHNTKGLQPVQIKDEITKELRNPFENETFTDWMWSGELEDCLEAGYTLESVNEGWSWYSKSTFMAQWADILYDAYIKEEDEDVRAIMKIMMVGLPGRFLKQPEIYTLVSRDEVQKSDIPILAQWESGESPFSDWYMRVDTESEKARDSAQLTPIGSFIISEARRELYHDAKKSEETGSRVIRLYIDSITTTGRCEQFNIGTGKGQYKSKYYHKVRIQHNRFYGTLVETGKEVLKAPGFKLGSVERNSLIGDVTSCKTTVKILDSS